MGNDDEREDSAKDAPDIPHQNRQPITPQPHLSGWGLLRPFGGLEQPEHLNAARCPTAGPPTTLFCSPVEATRLAFVEPSSVVTFILRLHDAVETDKSEYKYCQ